MKLIDADALKEAVSNSPLIDFTDDDIFELIDNAPTVDSINTAINIIKSFCKEHNACDECPMIRNCIEYPKAWKEAEGGNENE